jgi:hypothetical protein
MGGIMEQEAEPARGVTGQSFGSVKVCKYAVSAGRHGKPPDILLSKSDKNSVRAVLSGEVPIHASFLYVQWALNSASPLSRPVVSTRIIHTTITGVIYIISFWLIKNTVLGLRRAFLGEQRLRARQGAPGRRLNPTHGPSS